MIIDTNNPADGLDELEERFIDYPLPTRAPTHFTVLERRIAKGSEYAPVAISTAHDDYPTAYLVGERPLNDLEATKRYQRLWSTIPTTWEESQSIGFDYPGFQGNFANPGTPVTSGVTITKDSSNRIVVNKTSHGLTTSNLVYLEWTATSGGLVYRIHYVWPIVAYTTDTFTIPARWYSGGTLAAVAYYTIDGFQSRKLRKLNRNARIIHEYALPGVTTGVTSAKDFQPLDRLLFTNAAGDPVTELTASTLPSASDWITAAQAGDYFVADSIVKPYIVGGDILERVTTMMPHDV